MWLLREFCSRPSPKASMLKPGLPSSVFYMPLLDSCLALAACSGSLPCWKIPPSPVALSLNAGFPRQQLLLPNRLCSMQMFTGTCEDSQLCVCFSQRTKWALQDRSALVSVTDRFLPSTKVPKGRSRMFLLIILTPWRKISQGGQLRVILGVIHFQIAAPIVVRNRSGQTGAPSERLVSGMVDGTQPICGSRNPGRVGGDQFFKLNISFE